MNLLSSLPEIITKEDKIEVHEIISGVIYSHNITTSTIKLFINRSLVGPFTEYAANVFDSCDLLHVMIDVLESSTTDEVISNILEIVDLEVKYRNVSIGEILIGVADISDTRLAMLLKYAVYTPNLLTLHTRVDPRVELFISTYGITPEMVGKHCYTGATDRVSAVLRTRQYCLDNDINRQHNILVNQAAAGAVIPMTEQEIELASVPDSVLSESTESNER